MFLKVKSEKSKSENRCPLDSGSHGLTVKIVSLFRATEVMRVYVRYMCVSGSDTQYTSSTRNPLTDQFCEQPAASGMHHLSKSNLSWMDINLKWINQGDGSKQHMPKT